MIDITKKKSANWKRRPMRRSPGAVPAGSMPSGHPRRSQQPKVSPQLEVSKPQNIPASSPAEDTLKIIPLGGLGEVGKNMSVLEYKDDIIIIDAGLKFPDGSDMPGIDFLLPNVEYLEKNRKKIRGLLFTHGHMDHIGGFPYLQEKLGNPDL